MYKKVDLHEEIQQLKEYDVRAYSGKEQRYLIITVKTINGNENRKYYFADRTEYSKFLQKIRRMIK